MNLEEVSDDDLREMRRLARAARQRGLTDTDAAPGIEAYGIHGEDDLERWEADIEAELARRGTAAD